MAGRSAYYPKPHTHRNYFRRKYLSYNIQSFRSCSVPHRNDTSAADNSRKVYVAMQLNRRNFTQHRADCRSRSSNRLFGSPIIPSLPYLFRLYCRSFHRNLCRACYFPKISKRIRKDLQKCMVICYNSSALNCRIL